MRDAAHLEEKIAEQITEIGTLIAQMKEERRLMAVQLAQLKSMLQRLRGVQTSLHPIH